MAALILMVFALAVAGLAGGGVLVAETVSFGDTCASDCQNGPIWIAATLFSFGGGLLMLTLGISLLEERRTRRVADRDQRRQELLARLVGD